MRKFKFRAWGGDKMYDMIDMGDWSLEHVVDPDTEVWELMQFTGLHDKDGKEIYEGDVVRFCKGELWIVKWEQTGNENGYAWVGFSTPIEQDIARCEIIGNIYENKEQDHDKT